MKKLLIALMACCFLVGCGKEVKEESPDYVSLEDLNNRGVNGYYRPNQQKPYNGEVRKRYGHDAPEYNNSSQYRYRGYIKEGFKEGEWIEYWPNGNKMALMFYKKGELSGDYIVWWSNGTKKGGGKYVDGKRDGEWLLVWSSGEKAGELQYSDGIAKKSTTWYKNGQKRWVQVWENGELLETRWNEEGEQIEVEPLPSGWWNKQENEEYIEFYEQMLERKKGE